MMDLHNSRRREKRATARKTAEGSQGDVRPAQRRIAAQTVYSITAHQNPDWTLLAGPSTAPSTPGAAGDAGLASVLAQQAQQVAGQVPLHTIAPHRRAPALPSAEAGVAMSAPTSTAADMSMPPGPPSHGPAALHQELPAIPLARAAGEPVQHAMQLYSPGSPAGCSRWESFALDCTEGAHQFPAVDPAPRQLLNSALELPLSTSGEGGSPATSLVSTPHTTSFRVPVQLFESAQAANEAAQARGLSLMVCTPPQPSLELRAGIRPAACSSPWVAAAHKFPLHMLPGPAASSASDAPLPTAASTSVSAIHIEQDFLRRQPHKADRDPPAMLATVAAGARGQQQSAPALSPADLEELLAWLTHWVDDDSMQVTHCSRAWVFSARRAVDSQCVKIIYPQRGKCLIFACMRHTLGDQRLIHM